MGAVDDLEALREVARSGRFWAAADVRDGDGDMGGLLWSAATNGRNGCRRVRELASLFEDLEILRKNCQKDL